jgi:hypothetical protein
MLRQDAGTYGVSGVFSDSARALFLDLHKLVTTRCARILEYLLLTGIVVVVVPPAMKLVTIRYNGQRTYFLRGVVYTFLGFRGPVESYDPMRTHTKRYTHDSGTSNGDQLGGNDSYHKLHVTVSYETLQSDSELTTAIQGAESDAELERAESVLASGTFCYD